MKPFMDKDFLLSTPTAQKLYHERLPLYSAAAEAIAENNGTLEEGLSAVLHSYESLLK